MKLKILSIQEAGRASQECVRLKVIGDCNLGHYMLADTTYTGERAISNKLRHIHWFADEKASEGDFIWLYTGKGKNTKRGNNSNTTTHVRYWGLESAVWNNDGDCAVPVSYTHLRAHET